MGEILDKKKVASMPLGEINQRGGMSDHHNYVFNFWSSEIFCGIFFSDG